MRIESVQVSNFRAIGNEVTLYLGDMTALIGSNGTGKTTLLLAIERFFSDKKGVMSAGDFNDRARPLEITVVVDCGEGRRKEITRKWTCKAEGEKTSVTATQYLCGGEAMPDYAGFLGCAARVLYVPAEHETDADGEDKKRSILQKLIDDAVRGKMTEEKKGEEKERRIEFQEEYMDELRHAECLLNKKLGSDGGVGYAPNARVTLDFAEPEVSLSARMSISDRGDGRAGEVSHERLGHGTRRAFYMAVLEADAEVLAEGGSGGNGGGDGLTLCVIDEPELHQHPQRQALLLDVLRSLSGDKATQVVYATHSPHFVTLKTRMEIRRVGRVPGGIDIKNGENVEKESIKAGVLRAMEEAVFASGAVLVEGYDDETILKALLEHKKVGDRSMRSVFDRSEFAVVNCGGKGNIAHFHSVLESLEIRHFALWDADMHRASGEEGGAKEDTKCCKKGRDIKEIKGGSAKLLGLFGDGQRIGEVMNAGSGCVSGERWACFGHDAPRHFADYFGVSAEVLEKKIHDGEDIKDLLDREKIAEGEFARDVLPRMLAALAGD